MAVEEDVKEVIIQTLSVKPEEVKLDKNLYDSLGVDSTEMVDLRIALEKKFGIKIEGKEIGKTSSPDDIIKVIGSKRKAF
ncbi:MAG: acyl carrier protein [Candidatus Omnitrophota bacterium]|nr:acyl carrier protein [Candidatus Omnitrophota bacterium]